jgi:alkaline phosphatase D
MHLFTRRWTLKLLGLASLLGSQRPRRADAQDKPVSPPLPMSGPRWAEYGDRVWLSGDCWANPMEDWRLVAGAAECQATGGNRNVHSLTHQIVNPAGSVRMSVSIENIDSAGRDGGAGFRVGIQSDIQEYRSNCFAAGGMVAGVIDGSLRLGPASAPLATAAPIKKLSLLLEGKPDGDRYLWRLSAATADGQSLGQVEHPVPAASILGNVAIVNNFELAPNAKNGYRYRFAAWQMGGDAFRVDNNQRFGPILWSMYSLSDSRSAEGFVMKLTALTGPMGESDHQTVELQIERDGSWKSLGEASLDTDAWTATFRIPHWDEKTTTPYRLLYRQKLAGGGEELDQWSGKILANPSGRPLRIAALTCQNDYAFPYEPVLNNLVRLQPDLLYFSGDQIYENHGGFGIIRQPAEPAILNYLRKFYEFGWAFRDAMRNSPTLCIPDDHDVFHGNLWGEGGKAAAEGSSSSSGGYLQTARMVNVVHKTNVAHHPDYFDPTPCEQAISVYYGDMVYGGVGFAIIGDRQFKSGPENVRVDGPRADHVANADFDTSQLDKPGLILLGDRQEKFLEQWVEDWRGHTMKILLSQTVFAGVATHHGKFDGYLKADLDCGGWPQTPRNRAIKILRKGQVLHINGDQHLTSLVQYGVDQQRDAGWSFCTPAIAVSYPRWWRPDELQMPHTHRPQHGLPNTGEFLDGLGNKLYVYAIGNPEVASKKGRYELAHQKGSGFGFVTVDTQAQTYRLEAFRFLCDATDGKASNQFPGWPVTIHQRENGGENTLG